MPATLPTAAELRSVRASLLTWYRSEQRDFPWRRTRDPYAVLVSEVMLQQTQASRAAECFPRFMTRFPTAMALAEAPAADVLAAWSGLGYYRRALMLQRAAAAVARDGWPPDVARLLRLPGIGPYTARAIASLAFGLPVGVVDTNVRRWLVRRFATEDRPAALQSLANALAAGGVGGDEAAAWTHASMEFGATVCRSRTPACATCPVADGCPSRGAPDRVAVARQPSFAGSDRQLRGGVMRLLANAPRHRAAAASVAATLGADAERFEAIVNGLESDGLVTRDGERLHLGPRAGEATIGS